jgi:hypothetical protein
MGRKPFDRAQDRRSRASPSAELRTGFDTPSRRRSTAAQDERSSKRVRGKWSVAIRDRFLALLRETGNVRAVIRALGHANMFYKRRRRDPEFAALWDAAVAAADARLAGATSRLVEGMGTVAGTGMGTVTSNCPPAVARLGAFAVADPATLLRPGRKRKPKRRGHVIRRTRGGRTQIALARECEMDAAAEADFLARLKATGNFSGSARAVGFHPASLFDRYRKWPAFARDCDAAIGEAEIALDFALVAHAHRLLRPEAEKGTRTFSRKSTCPPDPVAAIRILSFIDRRRGGRTTRGSRKGPPERSYEDAVASVLAKIEAIERYDRMIGDQESGDGDS